MDRTKYMPGVVITIDPLPRTGRIIRPVASNMLEVVPRGEDIRCLIVRQKLQGGAEGKSS
ncbi:MAG TPA: hypothetical protein VKG92_02785 [Flavobacteriales bacterium]|nr:hypothetical protein [Flavobacteriales bacterium]